VSPAERVPVLELREVKRHFGGIRAVDGVTLAIDEGAVLALIGPNGAGKSTLFALMMGELGPTAGTIRLDGRDMRGVSPEDHSRLGIGRTFQAPRLFGGLSVGENVRIALIARSALEPRRRWWLGHSERGDLRARARTRASHPQKTHTQPSPHAPEPHAPEPLRVRPLQEAEPLRLGDGCVEAALEEVGLLEAHAQAASSLSQGQRKRLELAMVLALRPRLLLLDEPTAGMGVGERATIMGLVMGAVQRRGLTLVFCEHDMETVFAHALRVVVMDRGRLVADGLPDEVRRDSYVQQIYLGGRPGEMP
jgi:branched-chain amino acid transport system ATP-binding protein